MTNRPEPLTSEELWSWRPESRAERRRRRKITSDPARMQANIDRFIRAMSEAQVTLREDE
jgi:hypothetical protein